MTAVASPATTAVLPGVSIVLPCHNEEANVAAAVRMACRAGSMNAHAYEVIVVDDGSRDATNAVATRLAAGDPHVHVVAHPRNRGYGAALRTGIAAARAAVGAADRRRPAVRPRRPRRLRPAGRRPRPDRRATAACATTRAGGGWPPRCGTGWWTGRSASASATSTARSSSSAASCFDAFELTSAGAAISAELLARSRRAGARICERDVRHLPRNAGRQSGLRPRVVVRASAELLRLRRTLA